MAEIKVTPAQIKNKADNLRQFNAQFKSEVEKLSAYEQQLAGMWEGEAQKAFRSAFNTDKGKMNRFYENVEKFAQAMDNIVEQYSSAEQSNTAIASQRSS